MMRYWRSMLVLLIVGVALGCTSPESTRTRGGGAGADVGNHPRDAVPLHAGNKIYYGTRTSGVGIGKRAVIGGRAGVGEETECLPRVRPTSPCGPGPRA